MENILIRSRALLGFCFLILAVNISAVAETIINKTDYRLTIRLNDGRQIELPARDIANISSSDLSSPHLQYLININLVTIVPDIKSIKGNIKKINLKNINSPLNKPDSSSNTQNTNSNNQNTTSQTGYSDKTLVCKDCGKEFIFSATEQQYYAEKGFTNVPGRCQECRMARKDTNRSNNRSERQMYYDAICSKCGQLTQVPYVPSTDRPVYCRDCFRSSREY